MPYNQTISKLTRQQQIELIFDLFNCRHIHKETIKDNIGGVGHAHDDVGYDMSEDAYKLLTGLVENGTFKKNKIFTPDGKCRHFSGSKDLITYEHVVPVKWLYEFLNAKKTLTEDDVAEVLKYVKYTVVTKAEDKRLTDSGYKSEMPTGWTIGGELYARYNEVGIVLHKMI